MSTHSTSPEFITRHSLKSVHLGHNTYHHFMWGLASDSPLDVLMHNGNKVLDHILCQDDHPLVLSSHDVIISSFSMMQIAAPPMDPSGGAPKVDISIHMVMWDQYGLTKYQELIAVVLPPYVQ